MARTFSPPDALRRRVLSYARKGKADVPAIEPQTKGKCHSFDEGAGDAAGGCGPHLTLSASGLLPKLCCMFPGAILWSSMLTMMVSACFNFSIFYTITAALTVFAMYYSSDLSLSSIVGTWNMRQAAREDWHEKLSSLLSSQPDLADVMHVVILPNYKENEQMLLRTLQNIAASPMARESIKVVLAMEAREGPAGAEKAERLINEMSTCFADIFATFHPANLPGDLAGKSSNTQWAYQQMLHRYSHDLSKCDASRVLLTVGDADTLFHVQYWSALAYQALTTPFHERIWSFWQPPVLLLRNVFSPPGMTRMTGYATCLFELAGLANQNLTSAFCYSSYSLTLSLANHRLIKGWDRDVIAEDHHMFCKCFFASIWESSGPQRQGASRVKVRPVYLPALSYLVESNDGWFASLYERFQQACRHSQGVSEVSYTLLNYISLMREFGVTGLSCRSHRAVWAIVYKMVAVHIITPLQALAVFVAMASLIPSFLRWTLGGGFAELIQLVATSGLSQVSGHTSFGGLAGWVFYSIFGPIPPMTMMMTVTSFYIIRELLQGNLTRVADSKCCNGKLDKLVQTVTSEDVQGLSVGPMSLWRQVQLLCMIQTDYLGKGHVGLFLFGLIPILRATISLMRHGNKFEYVVGAKPT